MTPRKALQIFCKGMPAWRLMHTGAWLLRLDLLRRSACQVCLMETLQILLKQICSCQVVLCARSLAEADLQPVVAVQHRRMVPALRLQIKDAQGEQRDVLQGLLTLEDAEVNLPPDPSGAPCRLSR